MKLGQTSVIHFLSGFISSLLGFVATIYTARILGPEPIGIYHVAIGLVSWLSVLGRVGLSRAISKRVSESDEPSEYAIAAASIIVGLFILIASGVLLFRDEITAYVEYPATVFMILILFVVLLNSLISSLLVGLKLVHISGALTPIKTGSRAFSQIGLIIAGAGTAALFIGHIVGFVVIILLGLYYIITNIDYVRMPSKRHYDRLINFAKFSWLGNLQSQMFSYTDIIVLGYFVSSGLIGVYAVAWSISEFLILFSGTLTATLFPEMSEISAEKGPQAVSEFVRKSLTFSGLFLIPGFLGGIILGERILRIYGPEFPVGDTVLSILIFANLFMGYQNQLLNVLNAVDRPDLAFRVNVIFISANVSLNLILIYFYGWVGAAVATLSSVVISLVLAYRHVSGLISFDIPLGEILRQWIAAGIMGGIVYYSLRLENTHRIIGHNFTVVSTFVAFGATIYFTCLLALSQEFRTTVARNVPVEIPFVSQ